MKIWINDLNPELFCFWQIAQADLDNLVAEISYLKKRTTEGKALFEEMTKIDVKQLSNFQRAVRFFILNRITFSGTVESGGYSEQAFQKRFTDSCIDRLSQTALILKNVKITNFDYNKLLITEGQKVFIFLDPPYFSATKSKLYGKKGNLHKAFDHTLFAENVAKCQHQWLITYDNCPTIRDKFKSYNITEWELQYGMNNYQKYSAAKGQELMIYN